MTRPRVDLIAEGTAGSESARGLVAPALVLVIVVVLLPAFYVLSIGPVVALEAGGYIEVTDESLILYFYWPILWAADNFGFVETVLEWYVDLWDG